MAPKLKRAEKFWEKVDRDHPSGCWLWQGAIRQNTGYGHFNIGRRGHLAHRIAYELARGPISDGEWVLHTCDVKACVNPEHLYLGTIGDNTRDAVERDRVIYGQEVFGAKLNDDAVREIRAARGRGELLSTIAARYGVTEANVSMIARRRTWRRVA